MCIPLSLPLPLPLPRPPPLTVPHISRCIDEHKEYDYQAGSSVYDKPRMNTVKEKEEKELAELADKGGDEQGEDEQGDVELGDAADEADGPAWDRHEAEGAHPSQEAMMRIARAADKPPPTATPSHPRTHNLLPLCPTDSTRRLNPHSLPHSELCHTLERLCCRMPLGRPCAMACPA